jgi:hypothetical protein
MADKKFWEAIKIIQIADRKYELIPRRCPKCNKDHLEVWRWCGASFSRYFFSPEYNQDDLEAFVERIDEQLLQNSAQLLHDYHQDLSAVNSERGIEADNSFAFRLLEYGRQRLSELNKLGMLDSLISDSDPKNDQERALRLAFELGSAAAEHRIMENFEDYIHDGIALEEWREEGLPKARAERLRQGERSRKAILRAAQELYAKRPDLIRNDTETAREIFRLNLPELQKGHGHQLSLDSITKHLRQARKHPAHQEK